MLFNTLTKARERVSELEILVADLTDENGDLRKNLESAAAKVGELTATLATAADDRAEEVDALQVEAARLEAATLFLSTALDSLGIEFADLLNAEGELIEDAAARLDERTEAAVADRLTRHLAALGLDHPIDDASDAGTKPERDQFASQKEFWARYNAIQNLGERSAFYRAHRDTLDSLPAE